jgi:hypothetical protein
MDNLITPLTAQEQSEEERLIKQISEGFQFANKSYMLIVGGLNEVKQKKLYREVGTLKEWATKHFRFGDREFNYYLEAGEAVANLEAGGVKDVDLPLTHATAINMVKAEDQVALYNAVQDEVKATQRKRTRNLIVDVAARLESQGLVSARDGVTIKPNDPEAHLKKRIALAWAELTDEAKCDIIVSLVKGEPIAQIKAMAHLIKDVEAELDNE